MSDLTNKELVRYQRQMLLPEFGYQAQIKLKNASVLVIGAGGLGSPALLYLAGAGVGTLGIVDFDVVSVSNLHRQVLYTSDDVGKPKVQIAKERLERINPHISIVSHALRLDKENALDVISPYDVVIDGSDNFPTRYLVNDACVFLHKTLVYGAVFKFEGHVSVFNQLLGDGLRGPNYRDLFPEPPFPDTNTSCNVNGVLGMLPGIVGSMQATEAVKIITGIGTTLQSRLMLFDAFDFTTRFLNVKPSPDNPLNGENPSITELIDYEVFCNGVRAQ